MKSIVFPTSRKTPNPGLRTLLPALLVSLFALAGCNSGEDTEALPNTGSNVTNSNYNGPAPATDDVQNFKRSVWDNLVSNNRCGACHSTHDQAPQFVHDGDINIAYAQANSIVNLSDPGQSLMVTKVANGHNCWLTSDSACADTITSYITGWAGSSAGSVKTVELKAPALKPPGETKLFPADSTSFGTHVYPLLEEYCSDCHVEGIQSPYIASSSVATAYSESQSRINLQDPMMSRLVQRLVEDSHGCWDPVANGDEVDCAGSGADLTVAIEAMAAEIDTQDIDPDLVASMALTLNGDGLEANSGGRFEDNIIALYEFKTGQGLTAFDTSGIEPALHLTLSGNVDWVGGWGIEIGAADAETSTGNGKAQGSTTASKKLHDLMTASGEYSVEAWVVPGNTTQEDARIVTYSGSSTARNVTLGQTLQNYEVLQRSTTTDQNSAFATADGDLRVQATLQHVVVNFTPSGGRKIYVNGEYTGDMDPSNAGLLNEWDDSFALVLGNETDGNSLWQGALRLVAIHNRALTNDQIRSNFEAGVGQKFFLLFSVSHLIDVPESFVVFQVSQFDNYGYLFAKPFFVSLDDSATPQGIPVKGIRISINGKEASVGQAFANMDLTLNSGDYVPGTGQVLSEFGTVIGLEQGPDNDEFFLSFEQLGEHQNVVVEAALPPTPAVSDLEPVSHIGLKTFDEINASMSYMTTVPVTNAEVAATFSTVRQALPSSENIQGFLSSQQMAVTQMAIQYCDALVENPTLRSAYFPDFNFAEAASTAFDETGKGQIITPLIERMVGVDLVSQPTNVELNTELGELIDKLTICTSDCDAERTKTVVKASCAAVLGSAVTLVQ